ncbi:MAG: helix-turn-helix transcriptional regulator [Acidimicrobiia bacterium]
MRAGLSQDELATRSGVSRSQISRLENGRHQPDLALLRRIATALDKRLVVGFEATAASGRRRRDLVTF